MATHENLTPQELEELQEYVGAMKELEAAEPEYNPFDPPTGDAWEEWNKKCVDLNNLHRDIIVKAIMQYLRIDDTLEDNPQSVALILDEFLTRDFPKDEYEQVSLFPEDEQRQRLREEVLSALPRLKSLIPQKHLIPNNKLANVLTQDIIDAGMIELDVSDRKSVM